MTTQPNPSAPGLPPLPEPTIHEDDIWRIEYFTATQMQAYALAAIASQGDAVRLTPDEIEECLLLLKDRDGSDFEPECPSCTAYKKLAAITAKDAKL